MAVLIVYAAWALNRLRYIFHDRGSKRFMVACVFTLLLILVWMREVIWIEWPRLMEYMALAFEYF